MKEMFARLPMMMLGGSPMSVAVPPMLLAITSAIKNGTGGTPSRSHSSKVTGAISSAYSSGYAAGSANTAAAYAMGVNYAALPAGAMAVQKNGNTYYLVGNTWFQPAYGANGVYYRVVPTP